jgi:hypothetical protein
MKDNSVDFRQPIENEGRTGDPPGASDGVNAPTGVVSMPWIRGLDEARRRGRIRSLPRTIEILETRALLADGISPAAGPAINAVAGVAITNADFASFTITDSTGEPGSQ